MRKRKRWLGCVLAVSLQMTLLQGNLAVGAEYEEIMLADETDDFFMEEDTEDEIGEISEETPEVQEAEEIIAQEEILPEETPEITQEEVIPETEEIAEAEKNVPEIETVAEETDELFKDEDLFTIDDEEEGEKLLGGVLSRTLNDAGYNSYELAEPQSEDTSDITTTCTVYSGNNIEKQNYRTWSSPITSYLTSVGNGDMMRVQGKAGVSGTLVEYYDSGYNLKSTVIVAPELPIFGGFYEMGGYYYLLTGQTNTAASDEAEVYRITKYDTSWNRIASCSLFGENTAVPFDAGNARFAQYGNYMMIRTCHEMYNGHQANVTIQVDTASMKVTDSYTQVMNISCGYVSHSFNQFIQVENGQVIAVDHGDAYPRAAVLVKYNTDMTDGTFTNGYGFCSAMNFMNFPGETGQNYTGASLGGFEVTPNAYLLAGNYETVSGCRNIFVAAADKSMTNVNTIWYTDYAAAEDSAQTPHLVNLGDGTYMLMWSSNGAVYYMQLDGSGQRIGDAYRMVGNLSDCVPSVINGKLIWYTWYQEINTFYEISLSNLAEHKAYVIHNGHKYEYGGQVSDGMCTRICKQCGMQESVNVPTDYSIYWGTAAYGSPYYGSYHKNYTPGEKLYYWCTPTTTGTAEISEMEMEITAEDPSLVSKTKVSVGIGCLTFLKPGRVNLTVQAKYNPAVKRTYTISVNDIQSLGIANLSETSYTYDGTEKKPAVTLTFSGTELKEGIDYQVSYENNVEPGNANVILTGIGNYQGTIVRNYEIQMDTPKMTELANTPEGQVLTWNSVTGAEKYYVYRKKAGGSWQCVAKTTALSLTNRGVASGTLYVYKVKAVRGSKISPYCATELSRRFIAAPKISSMTNAYAGITVKWNAVNGAEGYYLYRKSSTGSWKLIKKISGGTVNSYVDTAVKNMNGETYTYCIKPLYKGIIMNRSVDAVCARMVATGITGITNSTAKSVQISWKQNTKADGYEICYKSGSFKKYIAVSGNLQKKTITGLTKGKTYQFYVRNYKLVNGEKNYSGWSNSKTIKIVK